MQANTPNLPQDSEPGSTNNRGLKDEQGIAMVLVMIALSLLIMCSAYLFLSSVEDLRISDNSESMIQARLAARAGIDHAREVLRGLTFNDLLKGPDGTYTNTTDYLTTARAVSFRNPAAWATFRSLNIADPTSDVSSLPDDGLITTGSGAVLVPKTGIAFTATNPYGSGTITTARYFLKVTDNNGEASELARDAANNPFVDGDGTIIIRSVGVARTIQEGAGANVRRNSVAIYESRFYQGSPFANLGSPAVVVGSDIRANFSGNSFDIIGNSNGPGIGTIDTNLFDGKDPAAILKTATAGKGNISGNCAAPNTNSCIGDITSSVMTDPSKSNLANAAWLYDFVTNQVPAMADYTIPAGGSLTAANIGTAANPKITIAEGDLTATGDFHGAGLLVVKGALTMGGAIQWDGLVLVIGKGEFWTHGMNNGIFGGLVVAGVSLDGSGQPVFTAANTDFDIRGNSNITTYDGSLANMGNGLVPLKQLSFREIPSGLDP
jgi:hypothetical protein